MKRSPLKRKTRLRSFGRTRLRRKERYKRPDWKQLVLDVLMRDKVCRFGLDGCTGVIETAGHLTYTRFGQERLTDLAGTCHACNAREHLDRVFWGKREEMAAINARLLEENEA